MEITYGQEVAVLSVPHNERYTQLYGILPLLQCRDVEKAQVSGLTVYTDTWGVFFGHSQAPRSAFVIDLLYYLSSLDVSQVDIEIWVKAAADCNNGAC